MTSFEKPIAERILALVCSKWVRVAGDSMAPTLTDGQWLRVDRRAYRDAEPQRGDVVLFEHPHRAGYLEVKRIAGAPGDLVPAAGDSHECGGEYAPRSPADDASGAAPEDARATTDADREVLGDDQYFVVGDNRARSTDSRAFGPISRRHIVGKVVMPPVEPPRT